MNLSLKPASIEHFSFFYELKSEKGDIYWSGHVSPPDYLKLKKWFLEKLYSKEREIVFFYESNQVLGYAYIDIKQDKNVSEISYSISENYQGKGIGTELIKLLVEYCKSLGMACILAKIFSENTASIRVVEKNGFKATADEFMKYFMPLEKELSMKCYELEI